MARATRSPTTSCSTPPEVALYAVRMDVELPQDLPGRDEILAREKACSQDLRRSEQWRHIWRITGQYSNLSIFDVADNEPRGGFLQRGRCAFTAHPTRTQPVRRRGLGAERGHRRGSGRRPLRGGRHTRHHPLETVGHVRVFTPTAGPSAHPEVEQTSCIRVAC